MASSYLKSLTPTRVAPAPTLTKFNLVHSIGPWNRTGAHADWNGVRRRRHVRRTLFRDGRLAIPASVRGGLFASEKKTDAGLASTDTSDIDAAVVGNQLAMITQAPRRAASERILVSHNLLFL